MASPPKLRIVCLSQGFTDAICALGLHSCLVGRSQNCSGPPPVLALPCVSSNSKSRQNFPTHTSDDKTLWRNLARVGVNWELLQELEPDLIFFQGQTGDDTASSPRAPREAYWGTTKKCRIVSLESHTIEDVFTTLETIADYCGARKDGIELVHKLRSQWKLIKQKTPQWADGMPWVSVACLSSVNPLTGAGYWIPDIISCAGGSSLCGRAGCVANSLTLGDLIQEDADVIVFLCHGFSIESIDRELSWLKNDKTWRQLRAIKANRFFVANADRFFIDSGPNVVLSAEMMVEILHGFGHGHEGQGFLRWNSYPSAAGIDVSEDSIQSNPAPDECIRELAGSLSVDTFGSKGFTLKQSSHGKVEVLKESLIEQSSAHDHPKYVTDVYESKKNVSGKRNQQDLYSTKSKLDSCNEASVFAEAEQKDLMEDRLYSQESGNIEVDSQRCLNAKNSRHMTPTVSEALSPAHEVMVWDEPGEKWQKPTKEIFLNKAAGSSLVKSKTFVSQNSRMKESLSVQVLKPPKGELAETRKFLKQYSLDGRVKSTLISDERLQKGSLEQELISKVWASTQSAAKARSGMPSVTKDKVFNKSRSVAVCSGVLTGKNSGVSSTNRSEVTHKSKSLPRQVVTPSVSSHDCELSKKDLSSAESNRTISRNSTGILGEKAYRLKRQQLSMVDRSLGQSSSDESFKKNSLHTNPVNPTTKGDSRNPRILRNLVLQSLAEIQSADCLLLSGGLASSILAEATPLARSGGFKFGFTVIAGSAATDRAFAEDVVKCCGMEHVVIGDSGKGSAVALLARELTFVVQTLRTFDPVQIRNCVPIAAALREAKLRGFNYVVTGDGTDELFSGDCSVSSSVYEKHSSVSGVINAFRCSAVLLGEALGLKVVQPFLHPKIIELFKTLGHADMKTLDDGDMVAIGSGAAMSRRSFLRRAFPRVAAACREKDSIAVGSGLSTVSEYFSTAISVSVVQSKATHIKQKDEVCIRDAEHLVYYRAFKRIFKGKVPPGMIKGGTEPCIGCGYQLSSGLSWYCLVCGHNLHRIVDQIKKDKVKYSHEVIGAKSSPSQASNDIQKHGSNSSNGKSEIDKMVVRRDIVSNVKASTELAHKLSESWQATNGRTNLEKMHSIGNKKHYVKGTQSTAGSCKIECKASIGGEGSLIPNRKPQNATRPKYFLALGAGSAALLLLLQLLKS